MLAQEVAKAYAKGLFLSVRERNLGDRAYSELQELRTYLESDPTLLDFLVAPHVLDEHKLALVRDVFTDRVHQLFVELLVVLVKKHRVGHLPGIIDEFVRLVEAKNGVGRATIITAVALTDDEKDKLTARLAARTNLTIQLDPRVDPDIIGGMIVIMHNEIIDGSIRRGIDKVDERLAKVRVH